MASQVIWKFNLELIDEQKVLMPIDPLILTVQMQGDNLCVWALVDPNLSKTNKMRTFYVVGTGHPVPKNTRYINTVQEMGGKLIWHIFMEN